MSSYSLGEELAGLVRHRRAVVTLQDEVAQLFEEARDDVYRYLLTLGLYPPEAQEATQEVSAARTRKRVNAGDMGEFLELLRREG